MSTRKDLTSLAQHFLEPTNATHRQYEALRAYLVECASIWGRAPWSKDRN